MTSPGTDGGTYLILGGSGMVGVHTARYLLDHASPAKVISIGKHPEKPPAYSLAVGVGDSRYAYHQVDLAGEPERLFQVIQDDRPQIVINCAARSPGSSSWNDWRFYETNVTSIARIAEAFTGGSLQRWVQISTAGVYGSVSRPATEKDAAAPTSPYTISKLAIDLHLLALYRAAGFPVTILRPTNMYGPGQPAERLLPRTIVAALTGDRVPLEGGGAALKSYLYVGDLPPAIFLAAHRGESGETYNVGPAAPVLIRELVAAVASVLEVPFEGLVEIVPGRCGEDAQYWVDSGKISGRLGWKPQVDLDNGLRRTIGWAGTHLDFLRGASRERAPARAASV